MKTIIIVGSSRKDGETHAVVQQLQQHSNWEAIYLNDYNISYYDYEHLNAADDFIPLMKDNILSYDTLLFATPVYWYAMSGIMKVFFDRMTDLLTIDKETGRLLRNKNMAVISSSNGGNLGEQFWLPFQASAQYLGMQYLGHLHTFGDKNNAAAIKEFVHSIQPPTTNQHE